MKENELSNNDVRKAQEQELEEVLTQIPEELLLKALQDRSGGTEQVSRLQIAMYSGPLPSPAMLQGYENTHKGLADRIVAMAEKEQLHRHNLEGRSVQGSISKDKRGQRYALLVTCLVTAIGGSLIYMGHPVWGSIYGGATLVALVGLFLGHKNKRKVKDTK